MLLIHGYSLEGNPYMDTYTHTYKQIEGVLEESFIDTQLTREVNYTFAKYTS